MNANKEICLDEVSVRLLCSLKSERQKMGMSQRELAHMIGFNQCAISEYERGVKIPQIGRLIKLSEIFGYDLSSSVNYKYWHGQIEWGKLRQQLTYYGFTYRELSDYVGYQESAVCKVFWQRHGFSLTCLNAILGIFENERNLLKFREKLLRQNSPDGQEWWKRMKVPAKPNSAGHEEGGIIDCGRCEKVSVKC